MHWAPQPVPFAISGFHEGLNQLAALSAELRSLVPGAKATQSPELNSALMLLNDLSHLYLSPKLFELGLSLLLSYPKLQQRWAQLAALHYPQHFTQIDPLHSIAVSEFQKLQLELKTQDVPDALSNSLFPLQNPQVSVCMIVRNEAHCVAEALTSVQALAHEIIVMDTGSTDGTQALVKNFEQVKLFEMPWPNDFAQARNACLQHATGDWIMVLDADEVLSSEAHLSALFSFAPSGWQVYALSVEHVLSEGRCMQTWAPRVFKRSGIRYSGAIHELPVKAAPPHWLMTVFLPVQLEHSGSLPEQRQRQGKPERDARLQALVQSAETTPYLHYQYAHHLAYLQSQETQSDSSQTEHEADKSVSDRLIFEHAQRALEGTLRYQQMLPPYADWLPAPLPATLLLMAQSLWRQKQVQALIVLAQRHARHCPYVEWALLWGRALMQQQQWQVARRKLLLALDPLRLSLQKQTQSPAQIYLDLLHIGLQSHQALLSLFALRRLIERFPDGRCPGAQGNLFLVHQQLCALVGIREGEYLRYVATQIQALREKSGLNQGSFQPQQLKSDELEALCFYLLAYLWESWQAEVLQDALCFFQGLLVFPASGLESQEIWPLIHEMKRLQKWLYQKEDTEQVQLQPFSTDSPQQQEASLDPAVGDVLRDYLGAWRRVFERPESPPGLALNLMVRDAEKQIPRTLASCEKLVDEYILLDTGSVDYSVAVLQNWLKSHRGQLLQIPWNNHFAQMRNTMLEATSAGWVLVLDADEVLCSELIERIRALVRYRPRPWQLLALNLHNLDADPRRYTQSWGPRLFAVHPLIRYAGRVHGRPIQKQIPRLLAVQALTGPGVLHHGYQKQQVQNYNKAARRQLLLSCLEIQGHPNPFYLYHYAYFLIAHQQPPDETQAEQFLWQALSETQKYRGVPPVVAWLPVIEEQAQLLLLRMWQRQSRYAAIWEHGVRWAEHPNFTAEGFYYLGLAARVKQDLAAARQYFLQAQAAPAGEFPLMGFHSNLPRQALAELET